MGRGKFYAPSSCSNGRVVHRDCEPYARLRSERKRHYGSTAVHLLVSIGVALLDQIQDHVLLVLRRPHRTILSMILEL